MTIGLKKENIFSCTGSNISSVPVFILSVKPEPLKLIVIMTRQRKTRMTRMMIFLNLLLSISIIKKYRKYKKYKLNN